MATTTETRTNGSNGNGTPQAGGDAAKATVVAPLAVYFIHGYATRNEVKTDDAQVEADVTPVATRVGGVVLHMKIQDNQKVEANQVIAEIDDADYKAKVAAGAASGQSLEAAEATKSSAQASLEAANANLAAARDSASSAQSRVAEMAGHGEQSTPVDRQIAAAVAAAKLAHARVQSAQAALDLAKLQLSYTKITSPIAGYVSKNGAHDGQMVEPGMTLVMVVPTKQYVVANFKETQMDRIAPGDPVDISVDALGGAELHGRVESVSAGTGARFSMMPPDNATGNFVKVVQRVHVAPADMRPQ